ncbi:hypothetical protein [Streptomyces sp. NPDC006638]|uniref:hypothetical protein n=1 Tax=Streptomyces sp. NPDC006638 TaxID=3157183 RepID=UPI0033A2F9FD
MSPRPDPPLKCLAFTTGRPGAAHPAALQVVGGVRKGVGREAVPAAVRPAPRRGDGRLPVGWLHIVAPPSYSATPTAHAWCACGWERRAKGRAAVLALVTAHTEHRELCPLHHPKDERTAA